MNTPFLGGTCFRMSGTRGSASLRWDQNSMTHCISDCFSDHAQKHRDSASRPRVAPTGSAENAGRELEWFRAGSPDSHHFLSIHRTTAMARRHWAFVIEIIADSIRIEHLRGDELPANAAKTVTQSKFVACVDSETVREGQRPAGFLHDRSLVSAGNQRAARGREKEKFAVARAVGCFRNQCFSPATKF